MPVSKTKQKFAFIPKKNVLPHLIVQARAGTGKSTTLIEGLKVIKGMPTSITPSPQQAAVWEAMKLSADAKSIGFVAFNKSIAEELKRRVPEGCEACTMHSLGLRALTKAMGRQSCYNAESYVPEIICKLLNRDIWDIRKREPLLLTATDKLVSLCKMNLIDPVDDEALIDLASYYDIDTNGSQRRIFDLVPRVLEECLTPKGRINYDDMIWLPVALNLPIPKFDLLLIDESQDLNRCQQVLAKRAGHRMIFVGDSAQSIYGFAGADTESLKRLEEELKGTEVGCDLLPLTVTRRCGKAIVARAKQIVPDFEAHETCSEGKILDAAYEGTACYHNLAQDGDMVLCRTNAPLVSECMRFLKEGRKANIQGRDVGKGLIALIKKLGAVSIPDLVGKLSNWAANERNKEEAKRSPSEAKLTAISDKADCLTCFTEGMETVAAVIARIESIFTDNKDDRGIRLSSIHRAKGLEAHRVFILTGQGGSRQDKMQTWEKQQESNLRYVAITRAIEELVYVS